MSAWLIRVCISALLLTLIFHFVPFKQVWAAARQISAPLWLGSLVLFLCGHAASAAKWRILIGNGISYRQAFRAHLAGLAANLALPSVAGGDVVRAGLVMKHAEDKGRLAMGSLADRLLDTLGLALLAPRLCLDCLEVSARFQHLARLAVARALGFGSGWFRYGVGARSVHPRSETSGKLMRLLSKLTHSAAELVRNPGPLATVPRYFHDGAVPVRDHQHRLCPRRTCRCAGRRMVLCLDDGKDHCDRPDQPRRVGVREASMAGLLRPFGADPAQVVAIGLVWQSLLYVSGLIGFLLQLRRSPPQGRHWSKHREAGSCPWRRPGGRRCRIDAREKRQGAR